jgi:hypothetical protein
MASPKGVSRYNQIKEVMFKQNWLIMGTCVVGLTACCIRANAFLDYNGSLIGLGQTHSLFDRGAWVGQWNPSLLDRPGTPRWSLQLLSMGILVGNNSLSRNEYQRLFTGENDSEYWDDQDKQEILGAIPGSHMNLYFNGNFSGLNVSLNRFALNVSVIGAARANITKDFMTLALYGNELNKTYSFDDALEGSAWGAVTADFSIGKQLQWHYFDEFAVGATFRYLYGLGYAGVEKSEGTATVTENEPTGYGNFEIGYGDHGDGVGLDIAASALWKEKWEFGLTLGNLIGQITWDLDSIQVYRFDITNREIDLDSLVKEGYWEHLLNGVDTTYSGGTAKTRLPFYLQFNAGYRVNEQLIVIGEYQQGFSDKPGISKNPRFSLGGEYRLVPWLPLRTGLAVGGPFLFEWGAGLGLDFKHYTFDLAVMGLKGLFGNSHGVGFAFTNRLIF